MRKSCLEYRCRFMGKLMHSPVGWHKAGVAVGERLRLFLAPVSCDGAAGPSVWGTLLFSNYVDFLMPLWLRIQGHR